MTGDHAALYAAEIDAFDGTDLETKLAFGALQQLAHRLVATPWWPGPPVEITRTRRDARSSSARCLDTAGETGERVVRIRLAEPQWTRATVAHELAHALAGPDAGHGERYRAAYVDVVAVLTNLDPTDRRRGHHVEQLRSAFDAHGLAVGARRWPAPPAESTTGAIAL